MLNTRKKKDVAWKYISERTNANGKKVLISGFCQKQIASGGVNRRNNT